MTTTKTEPERLLVSIKHAAELMDVSEWTVRRLVERGDLPSVQFGRRESIRIPYRAIERLAKGGGR